MIIIFLLKSLIEYILNIFGLMHHHFDEGVLKFSRENISIHM